MESLESQVTLIIPSLGRPEMLSLLLSYFSYHNLEAKIIVLESGSQYRGLFEKFPKLNIKYMEYPSCTSYSKKIFLGARLVKTPYCCVCADDDLVNCESIVSSISFLDQNKDYSACQGYHATFQQNELNVNIFDVLWKSPSLDSNDPIQRLADLYNAYNPICWGVFRTSILKKITTSLVKLKKVMLVFQELLWSALAAMHGKVKRLDQLYCLRRAGELYYQGHPFYAYMESPAFFFKSYLKYKKSLQKNYYEYKFLKSELSLVLDLIHANFFNFSFEKDKCLFTLQQMLKNPKLTIFSDEVFNVIKMPQCEFNYSVSRKFKRKKINYFVSNNFLKDFEIFSENPQSHLQFLDDCLPYFQGSINPENELI